VRRSVKPVSIPRVEYGFVKTVMTGKVSVIPFGTAFFSVACAQSAPKVGGKAYTASCARLQRSSQDRGWGPHRGGEWCEKRPHRSHNDKPKGVPENVQAFIFSGHFIGMAG
jgi:hypothetical protein